MRIIPVLGGGSVFAVIALVSWRLHQSSRESSPPFELSSKIVEAAPLCPWREPQADLQAFFPNANRSVPETRILSGVRVELAKQLGRQPRAEENSLILHRVLHDAQLLGSVVVRRVKGEYGAIELVLAVNQRGEVQDAKLQRLREPGLVAAALQDRSWLARFRGRTHRDGWENEDLNGLPSEARFSAEAVREGIRELLILMNAAENQSAISAVSSTP